MESKSSPISLSRLLPSADMIEPVTRFQSRGDKLVVLAALWPVNSL